MKQYKKVKFMEHDKQEIKDLLCDLLGFGSYERDRNSKWGVRFDDNVDDSF